MNGRAGCGWYVDKAPALLPHTARIQMAGAVTVSDALVDSGRDVAGTITSWTRNRILRCVFIGQWKELAGLKLDPA